ncbi:MAG TPA: hypothetical protein VD907_06845 [Verrucomicrobiae bacterium]|nr:hypothetical protein [Verrucomicrobiae bacterium]
MSKQFENTPENKARFFALYFGLEVCYRNNDPYNRKGDVCAYTFSRDNKVKKDAYLELRPLSDITDEEATTLLCMVHPDAIFESVSADCHGMTINYSEGIFHYSFGFHIKGAPADRADYLRSRSFALPYMGVSVETFVEWGWIKLKGGQQ